jgi:hypothetical protein
MSALHQSVREEGVRALYRHAVLPVFAATLFVSAVLLFSVQPMFTKMVLPLLGGSPSVWSVAMVFFQATLLAGYAYAHGLTHWLDPWRAVIAHLALMALAVATLPLAVATGFGKPPTDFTGLWLIGLFAASIGLPFFAVSANAPILQAWFGRTGHAQACDPYFLYGASNLGSFAALIAYPLIIEPFLPLRMQSRLWSSGFILLMGLIAVCGVLMLQAMRPASAVREVAERDAEPVTMTTRLTWMALAFVPSALLVAVTSHISTDIAAAPFLWVAPLALFLLTFVLTFRARGDTTHNALVRLQPYVMAPLVIGLMWGERAYWLVAILLDLGFFFIAAMICHRELYLRRPPVRQLTAFYMWISAGGMVGGIASGLIAPAVFPDVWEYPILIVAALMCRPGALADGRAWVRGGAILAAVTALVLVPRAVFGMTIPAAGKLLWMVGLVALAALIMLQARHAIRLAAITAFVLIVTAVYEPGVVTRETARSFFGVHKVVESHDGRFRMLYHGTTSHGAQRLRDEAGAPVDGPPEPLTYYYFGGPLAQSIEAARTANGGLDRVAVVGLGTGSLACHARPGERWTYFEIDPVVARIARDPSRFRFLSHCAPDTDVVLGDARLTLAEANGTFDLIVLDAFSSDVVPAHLLTTEALSTYLDKLGPNGAIAFHISNRYVELASVITAGAAARGLVAYVKRDAAVTEADFRRNMHANSLVAVVARRESDLAALRDRGGWARPVADAKIAPWTDDYANVLAAIWRMRHYSR